MRNTYKIIVFRNIGSRSHEGQGQTSDGMHIYNVSLVEWNRENSTRESVTVRQTDGRTEPIFKAPEKLWREIIIIQWMQYGDTTNLLSRVVGLQVFPEQLPRFWHQGAQFFLMISSLFVLSTPASRFAVRV